jgi:hypothetical protein
MNEYWVGRARGLQDAIINTNAELNQFEGDQGTAPTHGAADAVQGLANELRVLAGEVGNTLALEGDGWDANAVSSSLHFSAQQFDNVAATLRAKAQCGEAYGTGWWNSLWPAVQTLDNAVRALECNEPWVDPFGPPLVAAFALPYPRF